METNKLIEKLKKEIRNIHDFPKRGIIFKDLTTVFKSNELNKECILNIANYYKDKNITKVVGIESRGFIMGGAIANELNTGFVPIRKPGKLPYDKVSQKYELEYGFDEIEIHKDALNASDIVLIHDDLLATGGTMNAAVKLINRFNTKKIFINFIVELVYLNGRNALGKDIDIYSIVNFNEGE